MAKNAVSDWSTTPGDNTDIGGISLAEGVMLPSSVNNAIRAMMAQVASAGFIGAASPVLTGNPTAPTPSPGDNDTSIATTAFVTAAVASKAPTASPSFTGTPTAPTPSPGDNDTSLATTAFVTAAISAIPAVTPGWDLTGQTWQSVTRTHNTSYQNTTGKPVVVTGYYGMASSGPAVQPQVSSNNSTWVNVGRPISSNTEAYDLTLVIPPNWYYRWNLSAGTCTIVMSELR